MAQAVKKAPFLKPALYSFAAVVFLALAVSAVMALRRPPASTTQTTLNNVEQSFDMGYKAEVIPCTLYPAGGLIEPEGALMGDIVKAALFDVNASVAADKAVTVSGDIELQAVLTAKGYWQKSFPLAKKRHVGGTGERHDLLKGRYRLDLAELFSFIEKVAEETRTQPRCYLTIQPVLSGTVEGEGLSAALQELPVLRFELAGRELMPIAEDERSEITGPHRASLSLKTPVVSTVTTEETIRLWGLTLPVARARAVFGIPALLMLLMGVALLTRALIKRRPIVSEAEKIEKTYGKRIFRLGAQGGATVSRALTLNSFGELMRLANERELPIFKTSDDKGEACYLVIDAGVLYTFTLNAGDKACAPIAAGLEK